MTTYLPRSAWTTVPKPAALAPMPAKPKGIAVHWPGTTSPIGHRSQADMARRLEGYRRFHVNGRGWTDIAYQAGIDQDGRVWDLRGVEHESAANGDQAVNLTYLAVLFLIGPGETPSPELRAAFTDWRERTLKRYPTATRIVGHRDIRPHGGTACPGPITEHLIQTDALLEDDVATPRENWGYNGADGKFPVDAWRMQRDIWNATKATLAHAASTDAAMQQLLKTGTGVVDIAAVQKAAQDGAEAAIKAAAADVADGD